MINRPIRSIPSLLLTLLLGLGAAEKEALSLESLAAATAVPMKNVDGSEISIASAKGAKGTLVLFSCNHCPFVVAWEERIAAIGNEALEKGVGVIQINPNDPSQAGDTFEGMQQRAKERGFKFPYTVDETSQIARAFGATRTPEVFLFDAQGKLVYHGAIDDNHQDPAKVQHHYLKDAVAALIEGKAPPTSKSKAVGCGIKFHKEK